jgi:hypothetical protein
MEVWQQIIALISTSVATYAVLALLSRSLLKSFLDKDLEKFKNELATQQFMFQKRFSLIHEKKAEVLGELYARLDRTERALVDLTSRFQLNDGRTQKDKKAETSAIGKEFSDYYSTKKIYLDESLCNKIEEIQKILHEAWIAFDTSQDGSGYKDDTTGLWKYSEAMVKEKFPPLKKQLEEQFRKELGIIDGQ